MLSSLPSFGICMLQVAATWAGVTFATTTMHASSVDPPQIPPPETFLLGVPSRLTLLPLKDWCAVVDLHVRTNFHSPIMSYL
ncbi:hypothetical protein BRADI_4g23254v3 [Brachypodium distachyon]|uniref:Secreted protein n=1 Tax=Brachypodium distachyon TaxID=15368 RepID=A0A0Q3ENH2_BRADI|nr:hypothetical protein BRADI_4g23254v3 [Brachypodium distachyon]